MPSQPAKDTLVIGVDIGGTKVAAGLVNSAGEVLFDARNPMVANDGPEKGLAAVTQAIESVSAQAAQSGKRIRALGIASPGPVDPRTGVVVNPPNLPCWRNFPLAAELAKIYRVPVVLDNDANAAGLAEALWGAGVGYHNVFYATFGSGIGTAIVFDGHIFHGRTGAAGEGGHITINFNGPVCGCGKHGCIEAYASGPNIARRARERLQGAAAEGLRIGGAEGLKMKTTTASPNNPASKSAGISKLLALAGGHPDRITGEMVGEALAANDPVAAAVLAETVELLAIWFGNIIDLLDPGVIIIGGGASSMLMPFMPAIKNRLPTWCVNPRCQEIPFVPARFGKHAGIAGAAALCFSAGQTERSPK